MTFNEMKRKRSITSACHFLLGLGPLVAFPAIAAAPTVPLPAIHMTGWTGFDASVVWPMEAFPSALPSISGLSQAYVTAGQPGFTLTVNGANYNTGSVILWNGTDRTTQYVSPTQLTVSIP